jgi:ABC-type uncharacterized transport system involved in gliding motility auxiliary subunit
MSRSTKFQAIALLLVAAVAFVIVVARFPGQLDWTEGNYYTLSPESKALVRNLEEPIELTFYFSRSLDALPVTIKNYASLVEDLLEQYVAASNGRLTLSVVDPQPDTEEEEAAIRAGIQRQQVRASGASVFFGLAVTCADQTELIDVFSPQRESFLEYDISQLIYRVQLLEKPVLGIITSLPVFGEQPPPMMMPGMPPPGQGAPPWAILSQLEATFEARELSGDELPGDLAALALIHPGALSPDLQYAIDQFLLAGKPVFAAVDPSSFIQRVSQNSQQMMMMGRGPQSASSDLSGLLAAWGIEYAASVVVGDELLGTSVSTGRGEAPVRYPYYLTIRDFAGDSPLTAQLDELWFLEPGSFALAPESGLSLEVLVETSERSGTGDAMMLTFQPPSAAAQAFAPDGEKRVLAGLVTGTFRTAFPEGKPVEASAAPPEGEEGPPPPAPVPPEFTEGRGTLLLLADSDLLTDQMSVQRVNFLGMNAITPLNNNLDFALNALDALAGNEALLGLRGKGELRRGFDRIEEMERVAEEAYQAELEALQEKLSQVQEDLRQLQQSQGGTQLIASPEVMQSITEYEAQEADLRGELRRLRLELREGIQAEKLRLTLAVVWLIPLLALVLGIISHLLRGRARRA